MTKSKCCGAECSYIDARYPLNRNNEGPTEHVKIGPIYCLKCGKSCVDSKPTEANNEKPLSDEEWINQYIDREVAENDGSYWGWNSDQIADARIHMTVALSEGRKRERKERNKQIIADIQTVYKAEIQQREEAAAREAWSRGRALLFNDPSPGGRETTFDDYWTQRKSQGGIGV